MRPAPFCRQVLLQGFDLVPQFGGHFKLFRRHPSLQLFPELLDLLLDPKGAPHPAGQFAGMNAGTVDAFEEGIQAGIESLIAAAAAEAADLAKLGVRQLAVAALNFPFRRGFPAGIRGAALVPQKPCQQVVKRESRLKSNIDIFQVPGTGLAEMLFYLAVVDNLG
jgi:hypothetical protein